MLRALNNMLRFRILFVFSGARTSLECADGQRAEVVGHITCGYRFIHIITTSIVCNRERDEVSMVLFQGLQLLDCVVIEENRSSDAMVFASDNDWIASYLRLLNDIAISISSPVQGK
jgi:hypothetical protein